MSTLEPKLETTFRQGTWIASGLVALGLVLTAADVHLHPGAIDLDGTTVVATGIACFVVMPVIGVVLMAHGFWRIEEHRLARLALTVLAIIVIACAVGWLGGATGG